MADDLRLTVVASSIDGRGIARIDSDSFQRMRLSDGMKVIVTYGTKSREMSAKQDLIYAESTARLMKSDMDFLRVEDGMTVTVSRKNGPKKRGPASKGKGKRNRSKGKAASLDSF